MPKHVQTWVVLGLAAVMMVVVAFSGSPEPTSAQRTAGRPPQPADPNQQQIRTYAAQLDEQVKKLQMEQARLDKARGDAGGIGQLGVRFATAGRTC
jgi:hypothetical protein